MKIALLAPIEEKVPPRKYGGIELVVYNLAEELHRLGHEVTVFASGDSRLSCRTIPIAPKAIGSKQRKRIREALTYQALAKAAWHMRKEKFDIIHNHIGWQVLLFKDLLAAPIVSTMHWTLENDTEQKMYSKFKETPYVSISDSQRTPMPDFNYVDTVYHGLEMEKFPYVEKEGSYLAFLGRFSPEKGPVEAINIAKKSGEKLIMAAKINDYEQDFYEQEIKPHIDGKQIQFIGEVDHKEKIKLLGGAKALLSPIKWSEPFGLVNVEAMACGTPVIGANRGSLPELIIHGGTGFLADGVNKMAGYVKQIPDISRESCRRHIEENFSSERMARQYVRVYKDIIQQESSRAQKKFLRSIRGK